jgi:hypothetical protein
MVISIPVFVYQRSNMEQRLFCTDSDGILGYFLVSLLWRYRDTDSRNQNVVNMHVNAEWLDCWLWIVWNMRIRPCEVEKQHWNWNSFVMLCYGSYGEWGTNNHKHVLQPETLVSFVFRWVPLLSWPVIINHGSAWMLRYTKEHGWTMFIQCGDHLRIFQLLELEREDKDSGICWLNIPAVLPYTVVFQYVINMILIN